MFSQKLTEQQISSKQLQILEMKSTYGETMFKFQEQTILFFGEGFSPIYNQNEL